MTPSLKSQAKRHYSGANVAAVAQGFVVNLDDRTPAGVPLILPTEALARLIAAEWTAQGASVDLATMPATRLARSAAALPAARGEFIRRILDYAGNDLLCYFAQSPAELVRRQQAVWEPVLDWAENMFGHPIRRASGVIPEGQSRSFLASVEGEAMNAPDLELAGLAAGADLFGSAILAFALRWGRLAGDAAFAASRIDEDFQAEVWGEDGEAARRAQAMATEARMLDRWFTALG